MSARARYAAVDVHYPAAGGARAALVVASDRTYSTLVSDHVVDLAEAAPYQPGAFYLRELPAVRAVLASTSAPDLLIVDGYVHLDPDGRPGLGAHVHDEFGVPVIGVAKTCFKAATHAVQVQRGGAQRPLHVTCIGITVDRAADLVREMAGPYRLPDALRRVDALSREPGLAGR